MPYWLLKSEPDAFSIEDLRQAPDRKTIWEGVRNYQARNFIRDAMHPGDRAFFYHSSCKIPAIVGIVSIASQAYPDPSQFDPTSPYYDAHSSVDNPRWFAIDVHFEKELSTLLRLEELKKINALENFRLLQRGNRLSVLPVSDAEWEIIHAQFA